MKSHRGQPQDGNTHSSQSCHLGPENTQSHSFEEYTPNDYQKIAHRIQKGEVLNRDRHIGYGKDESGKEHGREKEKECAQHCLLLGAADG